MTFKLVLNLIFAIIFECKNGHVDSSIIVGRQTDESPNICNHHIDSVFNNQNHQIQMIRKDWVWIFNEKEKKLEKPEKQSPKETYLLQSQVYFSKTPNCQTNGNNNSCSDAQNAKNLIIMLRKVRNADFSGSYQIRKVVNGIIAKIGDKTALPFGMHSVPFVYLTVVEELTQNLLGLKRDGNIYSSRQSFWPKELSEKNINKKHIAMVYDPKKYELIIIVNGDSKDSSKLLWNKLDPHKIWSNQWKSKTVDSSWTYIGMFLMDNSIYVFGVKNSISKVFTYSDDNELRDTQLDIQRFIGCSEKDQIPSNSKPTELEEQDETTLITSIVLFVLFIIVIVMVVVIAICCCFKIKPTALQKLNSDKSDGLKFGAIDSNLDLNIKVSEISVATAETVEPKPKPKSKLKPKPKPDRSRDIAIFFGNKKKRKKDNKF